MTEHFHIGLAGLLCLCAPSLAEGALTLTIENAVVAPGSTGSIAFSISSPDGAQLNGYDLPIDIGNDGQGIPPGFSNFLIASNPIFGSATISGPTPPVFFNYDYAVGDSGDSFLVPIEPTELFTLTFDVAADVTLGTFFLVDIETNPTPNSGAFTLNYTGGVGGYTIVPGSITTATAVPEPGTVALLAIGFGGVVGRSAYRKRKSRQTREQAVAV